MRYHTLRQKQRGISLSGLLVWAVILILVSISGLKVAPAYIEFSSIKRNLAAIVKDIDTQTTSPSQIKILFDKRAQIDNIKSINGQDIKINKENGRIVLSASYVVQIPLVSNISLQIDFQASSE
ncbi:DUF4845 domain-containing protein [Nitrosomonas sp. Is35]|uniref:DUF4845 domain-containing protein n=1 Tax=unclassified Nitrosomonas TaxID=2609265 RepID=UPI00294B64A8|nr:MULTISPECIES: DUF4845 domain-containing protein [unclassified Nitrosomonas]MDV6341771.1 DUF4845 domain-containing protein [Nitrosomonas sp. Is24]MDV6346986.1 DUF4845 domain-containing protein [Nitrosomonas sp. Is35]